MDERYVKARARLDSLTAPSPLQQMLDERDPGLVICVWINPATGEEETYATSDPDLINEYCALLEARRDSN